jgi:hypothetical protein
VRDNYSLFTQQRYEHVVEFIEREVGPEPFCLTELFWAIPPVRFSGPPNLPTTKIDQWVIREVVMDLLEAGILVRTLTPPGVHKGRKYYRVKEWRSNE